MVKVEVKTLTPFEDFIFTARLVLKAMLEIIQQANYEYREREYLEKLDKIKAVVRDLEFNPFYRQIKNKKEQKAYRTILKQLKAGCNKLEKAIMKGSVLYIF